jgi:hypothetical protein
MSLRKWLYKYKYLHAEYSELDEINQTYIVEFDSSFRNKQAKENILSPEESISRQISSSKSLTTKRSGSKDLYKQLSKYTHPDVGGSTEQFREINELYQSEDILGLIVKAEEHDIDLDSIEYSESDLERSCQDLETKCESIKGTLAWQWATSKPEDQDFLKMQYAAIHGLEYIKR